MIVVPDTKGCALLKELSGFNIPVKWANDYLKPLVLN